ncbi:UNVERIFIED_CONTAM: hypothetical protein Sangu_0679800 [Sesamum angustifolium]|uniref:Gag-pol polyprotein n=1 Tax=Sesamum angustifolium TaxID=2727405 RepID=A0AAW2PRF1_9LAMI
MRNQNNDALVISATLANFLVKKVLVDSGSSTDIMFYDAYVQLGIENAHIRKVNTPLTGFSSEMIEPLGEVMLPLSLGSLLKRTKEGRGGLHLEAPPRAATSDLEHSQLEAVPQAQCPGGRHLEPARGSASSTTADLEATSRHRLEPQPATSRQCLEHKAQVGVTLSQVEAVPRAPVLRSSRHCLEHSG